MSLGCLLRDQGRSADAVACLRLIYDRFTDGFDTADLITAKRLMGVAMRAARRHPLTQRPRRVLQAHIPKTAPNAAK